MVVLMVVVLLLVVMMSLGLLVLLRSLLLLPPLAGLLASRGARKVTRVMQQPLILLSLMSLPALLPLIMRPSQLLPHLRLLPLLLL